MKTKFTRSGLAAILVEANYWLANPLALKRLLANPVVTAEIVRTARTVNS